MIDAENKVTVMTAHSDSVLMMVEAFALWHGGEHRVNDLIMEWGDVDGWEVERLEDRVIATNDKLGAEIVLALLELQTTGTENPSNPAIPS